MGLTEYTQYVNISAATSRVRTKVIEVAVVQVALHKCGMSSAFNILHLSAGYYRKVVERFHNWGFTEGITS